MAGLKAKVNNLDVDKLKTFPADSSKLNNIVDNAIDTKIISTGELVTKTQYVSEKGSWK